MDPARSIPAGSQTQSHLHCIEINHAPNMVGGLNVASGKVLEYFEREPTAKDSQQSRMTAAFVFIQKCFDLSSGIKIILDTVAGRENDPAEVGRRTAEPPHIEVGKPRQLAGANISRLR